MSGGGRSFLVAAVQGKPGFLDADATLPSFGTKISTAGADCAGRLVGYLICWENYRPLARAAMYQRGIDVLLAPTWDNSDEWVPTLRHIAKEGQIFVVGVTACLRGSDVPRELSRADEIYGGGDDWMSKGNTSIVAPGGEILAGPLVGTTGT